MVSFGSRQITKREFILPNFLIAGAAKSGSTSVYYYLKQHPDIYMGLIKEPNFFSSQCLEPPKKGPFKKRIVDFEEYCDLFSKHKGETAIGEASVEYLYYYENSIKFIKKYLGDPKIVIILRNPVERAFSNYMMLKQNNKESLSFRNAMAQEDQRIKEAWEVTWFYKAKSFYYEPVKAYMEDFSNVYVGLFDDFRKEPFAFIKGIYAFLGVDPYFEPDVSTRFMVSGIPRSRILNDFFVNKTFLQKMIRFIGVSFLKEDRWVKLRDSLRAKILVRAEMDPNDKSYLQRVFHGDILKLQDLIQRDLGCWLNTEKR